MPENLHDWRGGIKEGSDDSKTIYEQYFTKASNWLWQLRQARVILFNEWHTAKFSKMGKNGCHARVCVKCVCVMQLIQQRLKITAECNKLCPPTASATFPAPASVPAFATVPATAPTSALPLLPPPSPVPVPAPALARSLWTMATPGTAPIYGTFKIPDSWFLLLQLQLRLVLCATGSSSAAVTT